MNNKHLYVRILDLSTGTLEASEKATIIGLLGSPVKSFPNEYHFKNNKVDCQSHIWDLSAHDIMDGSFRVKLYKQRKLKGDLEIGSILLNVNAFPINAVSRAVTTLCTPYPRPQKPKIMIEVHHTDNPNAIPFNAPRAKVLPNLLAYDHHAKEEPHRIIEYAKL